MKKYECAVDINAPIDRVVALFNDPDHLKEWQDGFVSYEPMNGLPRIKGSRAKITFTNGKKTIELIETILDMNMPVQMTGLYEHEHGSNTMINTFMQLPGNRTRYIAEIGNAKGRGLLPKLMIAFMFGVYKKHNQKWLNQFKKFVEKQSQEYSPKRAWPPRFISSNG